MHLEVLRIDLEEDLIELRRLDSIMEQVVGAGHELMAQFKLQEPLNENIYANLTVLMMEYTFKPQSTGISSLNSSGSITVLNEQLQQSISQYYASTEKIMEREDISNQFIKDKYEPKLFNEYAFIWNRENTYWGAQETYGNDIRAVPVFDKTKFLKDKSLEVLIFARSYQTNVQKEAYLESKHYLESLLELL